MMDTNSYSLLISVHYIADIHCITEILNTEYNIYFPRLLKLRDT